MSWWRLAFEAWLVQRLLRSPTFHRGVGQVHKRIQWMRHGKPPEDVGGLEIDTSNKPSFWKHFLEALQDQAGSGSKKGPPK